MLNYKNSLQNTSFKTNRKENSVLPTMNQFQTENTLSSPSRDTRAAQLNEIRGSIQGIINQVAKKATDNRTAVETVSSVNNEIIDVLSYNRNPLKQTSTSMENLIDPEDDKYYNVSNVALTQSVGPQENRNRYRSPGHNMSYQNNNTSFGSPIQIRQTNRTNTFGSPAVYGSGAKLRSPNQKLTYDETEAPSSFNVGYQNGRVAKYNLQNQASPSQKRSSKPAQEEDYDQGVNFDYSKLKSPNRPIPQQPLHQFEREDLLLLSEDLRKKLNGQIRRNNALFERCQQLEHENTTLRVASRKASSHISQFKENQGGSGLRSVKNSGNSGYPADLLAELERLKEQNDKLRKDTINMIKKK